MDPRLKNLRQSIESAIAGVSAEQMTWHPPGQWCTAEVLEHLYLTYTGTTKGFQRAIEAGKPLASPATLRHRMRTFVVTGLGYLPPGREAPSVVRPRGIAVEKILAEIGPISLTWIRSLRIARRSSAHEGNCWIIRFWVRSRLGSGGNFTWCMGCIT